jgi:DNA-binding MarR family transcriptional regulator
METRGGFLISQIKQIQGRIFEKLLSKAGVEAFNGAQGRILYVLWQEDGMPIVALSRKTGLAKTTLTSMLDRLENQELIIRCSDTADRRQIIIRLTDKAKQLNSDYNKVSEEMNAIFYRGFTNDAIIRFEKDLHSILDNLNESEKLP